MFELPSPTRATLVSVTNRVEKHGEESVPAISLGVKIEAANTILDALNPTLRTTLYKAAEGQDQLPGVEAATPLLRTHGIESIALAGSFEGWTLKVDHGIDENDPITFGSCKVDKLRCVAKEGGTVELSLRIGTSDVDAESIGLIGMEIGGEITIMLTAPKIAPDKPKPTDGGAPLFEGNGTPTGDDVAKAADQRLLDAGYAALAKAGGSK